MMMRDFSEDATLSQSTLLPLFFGLLQCVNVFLPLLVAIFFAHTRESLQWKRMRQVALWQSDS